jgi:hypothetical protein
MKPHEPKNRDNKGEKEGGKGRSIKNQTCGFISIKMAKMVVGLPCLTQPLLLYSGLGPVMLEQHRRSSRDETHRSRKTETNPKVKKGENEGQ